MSQDAADSTSDLLWTIPARNRAIAQCRDVSLSPVFGSVNIRTQPKESNAARILSAARKRGTRRTRSWSVRCRSRTDVRSRRSAVSSVCWRERNHSKSRWTSRSGFHRSEMQRRVQKVGGIRCSASISGNNSRPIAARAMQIRKCETNDERFGAVNRYPISVWDDFMEVYEIA